MSDNLKRALSGAVYVVIMWFGTSYSNFSCSLLFAVLGIICLYEMWQLRKGKSKILALSYVFIPFILIQTQIWCHFTTVAVFDRFTHKFWAADLILLLFILTWTFDTFAFLIGVKYGRNKIMPSISPKKSWEGFIGGFIFTIIASYISFSYFKFPGFNNFTPALVMAMIIPFTASAGDFIASYYKRKAEVKNSGNFIPGHGGMLDRMDAFMITIPAIYLVINLI